MRQVRLLLLIIIIGLSQLHYINCQDLIKSRKTSYLTYIYKLKDKEAKEIYKKNKRIVDTSYFHTLIDSFPTDKEYKEKFEPGHYLKTFANKNKQEYFITSIHDFDVYIFNNNTDLCIRVYDLRGNIIDDAKVKVRWKKLHYDDLTHCYIDKKSNQKGLLSVTYNGTTAYFDLTRKYNNSLFKRNYRKVMYGTPLKYVWRPVWSVVSLPVDGARSLIEGRYFSGFYRVKRFLRKIACLFDTKRCGYHKFRRKHTGYLVFNKPKYKPGDTVKFKAFILTKKGKPVKRKVNVILDGFREYNKKVKLTELTPYRKGGYEYQFYIHDSLNMQLDREYSIALELKPRKKFIKETFVYEDYELSKTKLSIRTSDEVHYRNKPFKLFVKGTDDNDLNLLDARIHIMISPVQIYKCHAKHVYIPDTILKHEQQLEPTNETEITIPDTLFPKVNIEYEIKVKLLTSDNEIITERKKVNYYHSHDEFDIQLKNDSLHFTYFNNGKPETRQAFVFAIDHFGNTTAIHKGEIPHTFLLEPYYATYTVTSDSLSKTFNISEQPSLIRVISERDYDSIHLTVDNPRNIPFVYNIYKGNNEKLRGYSDSLHIECKTRTKKNYYITISYLWGGEVKEATYSIPLLDRKLNIQAIEPHIVYPGKKTKIELLVTDNKGKPVPGVDITAYSITSKFDYRAPVVPYIEKKRKSKRMINYFEHKKSSKEGSLALDYSAWKATKRLDSIEYYNFIYPGDSIYSYRDNANDSITQFAPFVISEGVIQPVHVIYVDDKPVYFSWSTTNQPYSFRIREGYHELKLRTSTSTIKIKDIYIEKGKKTILSLNEDLVHPQVKIYEVKPKLSFWEQRLLYKYIFPYKNTFKDKYAYLEQGESIQLLNPTDRRYYMKNLAGPVSGNARFTLIDEFSIVFKHDPYYEYIFSPELLKMKSIDASRYYPDYLYQYNSIPGLQDVVLTKELLHKQWNFYNYLKKFKYIDYQNPEYTHEDAGKLNLSFRTENEKGHQTPLSILVFKHEDPHYLRIYPGNVNVFHHLKKGNYRLAFLYLGAEYYMQDSIYIQPDGQTYQVITQPKDFKKDSFSVELDGIIDDIIANSGARTSFNYERCKINKIYTKYHLDHLFTDFVGTIEGDVFDENGEPMIGANIIEKGTTNGTTTDIDGHYVLHLLSRNAEIQVSFVGYEEKTFKVSQRFNYDITLEPSTQQLDEIIVVGYGTVKKHDLTSSIEVVESRDIESIPILRSEVLQGEAAGVFIAANSGAPGAPHGIRIRGVGSPNMESLLFVIDGLVCTEESIVTELKTQDIKSIKVLKGNEATAIYGIRGANGVVIIETKKGLHNIVNFLQFRNMGAKGADFSPALLTESTGASSIRQNFSDAAFWKPTLRTDQDGKVVFDVIFPDDVTSWETYYLAMNGKRQSGQEQGYIKSYKPFMAQLAAPRFLIMSDSTYAIGKTLNYTTDSIWVKTTFELNDTVLFTRNIFCKDAVLDTLPVIAKADSLKILYKLEKEDGYFDGELRDIPVFPVGLKEANGEFYVLNHDTIIHPVFDTTLGTVNIYARSDVLDVIADEISYVINYVYGCNEQIASKLKALLAEKTIASYNEKPFRSDQKAKKLIRLLIKNRKESGLWGWWKNSKDNYWITMHVLEALLKAEKMGYEIDINKEVLASELVWKLENNHNVGLQLRLLKALHLLNASADYEKYVTRIGKMNLGLNDLLKFIQLKQFRQISYNIDTLQYYTDTTLFGNVYFSDTTRNWSLSDNTIQNTLLAYSIYKLDTNDHENLLLKIMNYFFEKRNNGHWRNTYESAQIIETILPDLIGGKEKLDETVLHIRGDISKNITEFPFDMKLKPDQEIQIEKKGDFPVYLIHYQEYFNPQPEERKNDFEITTYFDNKTDGFLKSGEKVKLIANVKIKKDAEYLMINIPIPGGCSYAEKKNNYCNETHREYFKHKTTIFCERLKAGEYSFEIILTPRYTGTYTMNPAQVELMYFPTFQANNKLKKLSIQ